MLQKSHCLRVVTLAVCLFSIRNLQRPISPILSVSSTSFYARGTPELSRLASSFFPENLIVHCQSIVYDRYSIDELGQTHPGLQWLTFPLPHELSRTDYPKRWEPPISKKTNFQVYVSPLTETKLAFLEKIYVITDKSFNDRHEHLKRVFRRHDIPIKSIQWQWAWNRTTCNSEENVDTIRKRLNLKPGKNKTPKRLFPSFTKMILMHTSLVVRASMSCSKHR